MVRTSAFFHLRKSPRVLAFLLFLPCALVTPAIAGKLAVKDMYDVFSVKTTGAANTAAAETTIRHQLYFDNLEGSTTGWGTVNFRQGQPNAWNLATGVHSCVGQAWWCGQVGLPHGDGYNDNWMQTLRTNVPINLSGTTGNKLTYKYRVQTENSADYCWVLIHDGAAGTFWDTLASYSGDFGASCVNATINIPNSWTTRTQPLQLMFLFGSDFTFSANDSTGAFTGWSIDDVRIATGSNVVKFFDDMEVPNSNWIASSPNPGAFWHIENTPATSVPATCFFLNTNVWVAFQGFGFGAVPDFTDAMLTTPTMDLQGIFVGGASALRLQFDNWINLTFENGMYWSLWIQGSNDMVTWTPWHNALNSEISGGTAQCIEGSFLDFAPYYTNYTGIQPGTRYIRLGFRVRDGKPSGMDGQILRMGNRSEGIYFDNIKVEYAYTISGVEAISALPTRATAAVEKIFPNPFNPSTTIEFSIPKSGPVALRIHDVQGRAVATLVHDTLPAGVYRVRWNGKSGNGRTLSSGVYYTVVESAKSRGSARLLMLK